MLLRLIEDWLADGEKSVLSADVARALFVASGWVTVNGNRLGLDDGMTTIEELSVEGGAEGATVWRWELVEQNAEIAFIGARGAIILESAIDSTLLDQGALMRLDSVAFPPAGTAMLHTHQGPGIRRLYDGLIRIDTEGHSTSYGPGGAWFEAGPEPVFAQAAHRTNTRFIRTMILPQKLAGISSISYVREEDRDKPKSQTYRSYGETLLRRTGV